VLALAAILLGAALGADADVLPYLVNRYLNRTGNFSAISLRLVRWAWLAGRFSWGGYLIFIILMSP
jgi:hypothetical protein